VFVLSFLVQIVFLQTLFKPGFIAPDLLLVVLLSKAYLSGRGAILWAILGGALLDLTTDNIGLNLALQTLAVYLFLLAYEKLLFRNLFTFLIPASVVLLLKRLLALFMMRSKFSFDMSWGIFTLAWLVEIILLIGVYFLYLKRKE